MIEELNKSLNILELERIKEILPDYIHTISKNPPTLTESLNYLLKEEIKYKNERAADGIISWLQVTPWPLCGRHRASERQTNNMACSNDINRVEYFWGTADGCLFPGKLRTGMTGVEGLLLTLFSLVLGTEADP